MTEPIIEPGDATYKKIGALLDEWIPYTDGFSSDDVDRQFNIGTREGKRNRWLVLESKVQKGLLTKSGKKYWYVDGIVEKIDLSSADVGNTVDLLWPFDLQNYIKLYPQSIVIVAGSSNAGKTAFLYNLIVKNEGCILFSSDMGKEEMRERFDNFEISIDYSELELYERYDRFSEVIRPDEVNIIDYLDLNSEVYMIGAEIDAIHRKLRKGIAIIAIQKRPNQDLGIGGIFSLKKARLYLSMDSGVLKIVKAKSRANPQLNPNNMEFKFSLVNGCKFIEHE